MKIGIIGCGFIAHEISKHRKIAAVYDLHAEKCSDIPARVCSDILELITSSDLVIEAASPQAVRDYALQVVRAGRDMLIMSVGGLADREFRDLLFREARERGVKIYLPSGAIGGLDIIRSARIAGIDEVRIRSTKPAAALGVECAERKKIFEGTATEAIKRFPKSTNVTVLLSIVSGMDVKVEIYADPGAKSNTHEIYIRGRFGEASITVKNVPSEANPKTSYLAALSPISILEMIEDPVLPGV